MPVFLYHVEKEIDSDEKLNAAKALVKDYMAPHREAKKVQKQLNSDPNNKALKKQYNYLQGQHDVQRAKARKAPEVGAKRSARKAAAKRAMTMSVKAAATAAAIGVGTKVVNDVMMSNNVTFNGQRVKFSAQNVNSAINAINKGKEFMGFFY